MAYNCAHSSDYVSSLCILVAVILSGSSFSLGETAPWYQGCFNASETSPAANEPDDYSSPLDVSTCCRTCLRRSFQYAVVGGSTQCRCLQSIQHLIEVNRTLCDVRCGQGALTCGSVDVVSVYSVRGPYLLNMSLSADPQVAVGRVTALTAMLRYAGQPNVTIGLPGYDEDDDWSIADVQLKWTITPSHGDDIYEETVTVEEDQISFVTSWLHQFDRPGTFTVELNASSVFSSLISRVNITIVTNAPTGLELTLLTPDDLLPSCLSSAVDSDVESAISIAIFRNETTKFEASVALGTNLTFAWRFSESGDWQTSTLATGSCHGGNCSSVILIHRFQTLGISKVEVKVSNDLGFLNDSLTVLVLDRMLSIDNFTVECTTPSIVAVHDIVSFVLNVTTTSQHKTAVHVAFQDGSNVTYDASKNSAPDDPDEGEMTVGNYGDSCRLSLRVSHAFGREGEYRPVATVRAAGHTLLHLPLDCIVTVQRRLESASIQNVPVSVTNSAVTFTVILMSRSSASTFTWTVDDQLVSSDAKTAITHAFTTPGVHLVAVNITNGISSVVATTSVHIQTAVSEVLLNSTAPTGFVAVATVVGFTATVANGSSGVDFEWQLIADCAVSYGNNTSHANCTFAEPGHHKISVHAFNMVSSQIATIVITTLRPISDFVVSANPLTLLGERCVLVANVSIKTSARFSFSVTPAEVTTDNASALAEFVFAEVGVHCLTATASNEVSSLKRDLCVVVREAVDAISVDSVSNVMVVDEPLMFVASVNGTVSSQKNVLYSWYRDGQLLMHTAVAMATFSISDAGSYNLTVVASNRVSESSDSTSVVVLDRSRSIRFIHHALSTHSQPAQFVMQGLPSTQVLVHINYGDGSRHTITHTDGSQERWTHMYTEPGLYHVTASCMLTSGDTVTVATMVSVQEVIRGMELIGPAVISADNLPQGFSWLVKLTAGTAVIYDWTIENSSFALLTADNQISTTLPSVGRYQVSVRASNHISQAVLSVGVTVVLPINRLELQAPPTVLGNATVIRVNVFGGTPRSMQLDFGDGNATSVSSFESSSSLKRTLLGPSHLRIELNHTYSSVGVYTVWVNVSNAVSSVSSTKETHTEHPISGVVVVSAGPLVSFGETAVVTATVATGDDLTFDWDFSTRTNPIVASSGRTSEARQVFTRAGRFAVTVYVSNPLHQTPVVGRLPYALQVIELVSEVSVAQQNDRMYATLSRLDNGIYMTEVVVFEARVSKGSDVMFTCHFGDGATQTVKARGHIVFAGTMASCQHRYTQVGSYVVSVVAFNALSNVSANASQPFVVQVAPQGLLLSERIYHTMPGNATRLQASISDGTEISFDWDMGDSTTYSNAGASIVHRWRVVGSYKVAVRAYNQVHSTTAEVIVSVQQILQAVDLLVDSAVQSTEKIVHFTATTIPAPIPFLVDYYTWHFGDATSPRNEMTTYSRVNTYHYRRTASYTVLVEAHNFFSSVVSEPLRVQAVDPLSHLQLFIKGEMVVGQEILLEAYLQLGSGVTYFWYLGDGGTRVTRHSKLKYIYQSKGQYEVRVVASNPLGNKTATQPIFILRNVCKPPLINVLGLKGRNVYHSEKVKVEAEVSINCSITSLTNYTWTIRNATTGEPIRLAAAFQDANFHDPVLYVPERALPYGNYSVELKVEMHDTIVYNLASTHFVVIPSPLVSMVSGGLQRLVSRSGQVYIDGSLSHDPDFPGDDDDSLQFVWNCSELNSPDSSCFVTDGNTTSLLPVAGGNSSRVLHLSGNQFKENSDIFVVKLTVKKAGRRPASSSQVLKMKRGEIIDLSLRCVLCESQLVNSNNRLVFQTMHPGYQEEELEFHWMLHKMADGRGHSASRAHDSGVCVKADGSAYRPLMASNDTNTTVIPTTTMSTSSTTTLVNATSSPPARSPGGSADWFPPLAEGTDDERQDGRQGDTAADNGRDAGNGMGLALEEGEAASPGPGSRDPFKSSSASRNSMTFPDLGSVLDEGTPGESGSSSSRGNRWPSGTASQGGNEPGQTKTQTQEGAMEGRGSGRDYGSGQGGGRGGSTSSHQGGDIDTRQGDAVVDEEKTLRVDPHLVSQMRYQVALRDEHVASSLNQGALVLRAGMLRQEHSYMMEVKVTHKVSKMTGSVLAYFQVNESPSLGDCTLKPDEGIEMETEFRVFCKAWQDKQLPLSYEVSWSTDSSKSRDIVYHGLNHITTFQLPAGPESQNNQVDVFIQVIDRLGARTSLCSLPVIVRPKISSVENEEDILIALVQPDESKLRSYVAQGDNRRARRHAQMVAMRLNRLASHKVASAKPLRTSLLALLAALPMRDEYEIQQTASAVMATTAVASELTEESLAYAGALCQQASERLAELATITHPVDVNIGSVLVSAAANVISGLTTDDKMTASPDAQKIVTSTNEALHSVIMMALVGSVPGEEPFEKLHAPIYVSGHCYRRNTTEHAQSSAANFTLPRSLPLHSLTPGSKVMSQSDDDDDDGGCYQLHMTTFERSPFVYKEATDAVHTPVASLSVYTSRGQEVAVSNLPDSEQVEIHLKRTSVENTDEDSSQRFTLHRHRMNVHAFNTTPDTLQQYVYLQLLFETVPDLRLFPIVIFLQSEEVPTPDNYLRKWEFTTDQRDLKVFLPPSVFNNSSPMGRYFWGVADSSLDSGRPRSGEARVRHYRLRLWRSQCVWWNSIGGWSSDGCVMDESATYTEAHCRCRHLTSFAAHFSLVPNDLSFTDIDDFFNLHDNPVTVILVACLLIVYAGLLAVAIRTDRHNARKGRCVQLVDNTPDDRQKYLVVVETGFRRGAGTTAKVSIVLHGDEGISETRELLSEHGQPLFERNSRDVFSISFTETLGHLWKVQVWHDNSGPSPSWFLSRITVTDMLTGIVYYFNCEKWFAVEEDDSKVEREIMVVEGGMGFNKVLWAKGTQYFADYHLWLSTMTCPSYSRFTCVQRLTCCLALVMSYLAVNAAWYKESVTEYRGEFAFIDVSWRNVVVGAITSLIVLPVNLLIVLLFRRSKVLRTSDDSMTPVNYSSASSSFDSTTHLLDGLAMSPSIFDQSMLHWQSLQEWAQRTWAKRHAPGQGSGGGGVQTVYGRQDAGEKGEKMDRLDAASFALETPADRGPVKQISHTSTNSTHSDKTSQNSSYADDMCRQPRVVKSRRCFLPNFFKFVAWSLCVLIILGCGTITILYGFRFGRRKSSLWLQSILFSLLQCVFITHPIIIILMSVIVALRYRDNMGIFLHHDDGFVDDDTSASCKRRPTSKGSNVKAYDLDMISLAERVAARQRSRYLRYARPPQEKQLIESRNQTLKERVASHLLRDGLKVALQFILLVVIAFGKDSQITYQQNESLTNAFVRYGNPSMQEVRTLADWWWWMESNVLDQLYWQQWYNGDSTKFSQHYIVGSVLIGHAQLRQTRAQPTPCPLPASFSHAHVLCKTHTEAGHENHWTDTILLTGNRSDALKSLHVAQHANWIGERTRSVVLEFSLFFAPSNLFSSVSLQLTLAPSRGVTTNHHVVSTYLYRYTTVADSVILICELFFILLTLLTVWREVTDIVYLRKEYLKNVANCLQVLTCGLSLVFIACFIYRFIVIQEIIEHLRATYHERYVDVSYAAFWDQVLRSLLGVLLLLTVTRGLKLLRHHSPFTSILNTLRCALSDIFIAALMFGLWLVAYASLGVAVFGSLSSDFRHMGAALPTVASLLTGDGVGRTDSIGWRLFIVSMCICVLGSLTAYMVASLTYHYHTYKQKRSLAFSLRETIVFYYRQFLVFTGLIATEAKHSSDNMLPAEFTMTEIESQVDEMLFKTNALAGTSNLPDKPPVYFTDSDCSYAVDSLSAAGSEERPLDEERFEARLQKIETNLFGHEPHLASLIQTERNPDTRDENQLRSQLELEIFRQLQLQRRLAPPVGSTNASEETTTMTSSSAKSHKSGTTTHADNTHNMCIRAHLANDGRGDVSNDAEKSTKNDGQKLNVDKNVSVEDDACGRVDVTDSDSGNVSLCQDQSTDSGCSRTASPVSGGATNADVTEDRSVRPLPAKSELRPDAEFRQCTDSARTGDAIALTELTAPSGGTKLSRADTSGGSSSGSSGGAEVSSFLGSAQQLLSSSGGESKEGCWRGSGDAIGKTNRGLRKTKSHGKGKDSLLPGLPPLSGGLDNGGFDLDEGTPPPDVTKICWA